MASKTCFFSMTCICYFSSKITCRLPCHVGMVVWNLLPSNVSLFVNFVIASSFIPTPSPIPTYFWFLQKYFLLLNSCLCSFFNNNCYVCCPRTCGWCVFLAHALTNGFQQYALPPWSSLQKCAQSRSYAQKYDHFQRMFYLQVAVSNPTLLAFRR